MFFKKHFRNKSTDDLTTTETPSKNIEMIDSPVEVTQDTNSNSTKVGLQDQDQYLLGSSILFNKFKNHNSGPDLLYENEAWSPENEYVGLFRKRRPQVEEQTSSTSNPQ